MGFPQGLQPLIGTEEATIDEKGRVLFSKKKRERLGESFAVVLGKVGGVTVYPGPVWEQLFDEVFSVSTMNPAREAYTRLVLGTAEDEISFDGQGRLVIPKRLREAGKLSGELLLIGCGDRIEIWAKAEWEKFEEFGDAYNKERRRMIQESYDQMVVKAA